MIQPIDQVPNPTGHRSMVQEPSGFTREEIEEIRRIGDGLEFTDVKLYGGYTPDKVNARGAHFRLTEETQWVFERMAALVAQINAATYRYDLTGFHENFYFNTYDGAEGQHFNWHLDAGPQTPAPRKLSAVLQLSGPEEYEGGDFEVMMGTEPLAGRRELGLITVFPSYRLHRVKPVTSGKRRALVAFAGGPDFR